MTPEQRHRCMSHIRSKDTKPELKVRRVKGRVKGTYYVAFNIYLTFFLCCHWVR